MLRLNFNWQRSILNGHLPLLFCRGRQKIYVQKLKKKIRTKIYNARALPLFCSWNLLFGHVFVAVVVVVCLSSLLAITNEVIIRCYWNHLFLSFIKHTSDGDPLVPGCCVEILFPKLKWRFPKLILVRFKLSFCFLEVYRFSSAKAIITYVSKQVITSY